jgi:hypothetical protein
MGLELVTTILYIAKSLWSSLFRSTFRRQLKSITGAILIKQYSADGKWGGNRSLVHFGNVPAPSWPAQWTDCNGVSWI